MKINNFIVVQNLLSIGPPQLKLSAVKSRKQKTNHTYKRRQAKEIISKLRQIEVQNRTGMCRDVIRRIGVAEQTERSLRWMCGGIGADQLNEEKRPKTENERLRYEVSDLTLDKLILTEAG